MINTAEYDRQRKVVDLLLTCHSRMFDKYRRRALAIQMLLLAASLFLAALVFVCEAEWAEIGLDGRSVAWSMNLASLLVFLLSLVETIVDWKGTARLHAEAKMRLFNLKMRYRTLQPGDRMASEAEVVSSEYQAIMNGLPPIPDVLFLRYKAAHRRKVYLSKLLDRRPFASTWLLAFRLRWKETRAIDASDDSGDDGGE